MDLSKLSDADLDAITSGDMSKVSDAGLRTITGEKSPAYQAGGLSSLRGLYSVLQGPTLGFADEIGGAVVGGARALMGNGGFKQNYESVRDYMRGAADRETADSPMMSAITRGVASAPLLAAKIPALLAGPGRMAQAGNAAIAGAGFGAASGAGESTAESLPGVGMDALKGGAMGGATSTATVPAAAVLGAIGGNVRQRFSPTAAADFAKQKVAEALIRDARGTVAKASPEAALNQAQSRLMKLGDEARMVDASGQNTKQLLDTMATLPGATKDLAERAIRERQAGRAGRMIGAAEDGLNPSGLRLQETLDDLIARRSEKAKPLYEKLYRSTVAPDDDLRAIVAAADQLGAGGTARKISTARQLPYTLSESAPQMAMRDLDHLKQGLDDIIQSSIDQTGRMNKTGAAVQELKTSLTSKLDDLTGGAYKKARDAFSGPSALMDAAKDGRRVWSQDDQSIKKALSTLSDGEQDAFRLGAFEALRSKLGNQGGQTEVMKMWRDQTTREKLRALFGDERAFRQFASSVAKESSMKGLEGVGRGSQTAARQYGAGDLDMPAVGDLVGTVTSATSGNVPGFLAGASRAWNTVKTPEPVRNAIGDLLLSRGGQGVGPLEDAMRQVARQRQQQAGQLGLLGSELGLGVGGLLGGR